MLHCPYMSSAISQIKKTVEIKLSELRGKRKQVLGSFKEKLKDAKIDQIKNSLLNK